MLKIALVIIRSDPQRGGAERYTADIAAALAARGHHVDLVSARFGPPIKGVNFVPRKARGATRATRYLSFLDAADAHLAGESYDIVHSMLPVRRCDIYHPHAGMAKAALGTLASRLNRKRRLYALVEDILIQGDSKPIVLCLSDYIKASILKHYPGIEDQLVKLFNAVDLAKFDPAARAGAGQAVRKKFAIPPAEPVTLMIAHHFEQKGLPRLIEASAAIAERPRILVVGKDDPARCARQAERLGIADRVVFAGTTDSPPDFYAAADFFVLPTHHDSCSLVALEALAMGLPVISTVFNGACEIMTEGKHGFILPDPDDVPALAAAMTRLLDAQTRHAMRESCLALRPALSFDNHVDQLEAIYRQRQASRTGK